MTAVYVVPCSGAKQATAAPAGELYTGSFTRYALAKTTAVGEVRILSALHGLVHPQQVLEPYDVTMGGRGAISWVALSFQLDQLKAELGDDIELVLCLPRAYRIELEPAAAAAQIPVTNAFAGSRGIGEMRGRLNRLAVAA